MATGSQAPISTVDLVDPFGDNSGVALYKFDGDATDSTGIYNGTASNVTYGTGKFGQCAVFDNTSVDNKISLSQKVIDNTSTYSISCWLKITTAGFGGIYCSNTLGWTQYGIEFKLYASMIMFTHARSDSVSDNGEIGTSQKADGMWRHYVATRNGTSINLYENTALVSSGTLIHNTTTNYANPYIGQYINNNTNTPQGIKQLDQLRLFNRALTQEEVTALYNESVDNYTPYVPPQGFFNDGTEVAHYKFDGDALDSTGVYDGTATNVTYATGKIGQCVVFNGTNSYVDISSISYTNDITVSFWATNLATTTTYGRRFFDFGSNGMFCCAYLPQTNKIYFGVYDGSWRDFTVSCLLSNTFFTHICMTINPITGTKGYINGSLAGSMANNTIIKDDKTANKIGAARDASTGYGFPYHGSIDQFRIFNRALTATEVTALYNEGQ